VDVTAYNLATQPPKAVVLGAIAQSIWTDGFKSSQERVIQVSKPINATIPNLYDRLMTMENFQFAAGQSLPDIGSALINMALWRNSVPRLAYLSFMAGNQTAWLGPCGITKVELVAKKSALVIFGYTIIGGAWTANKPF
jgi:hypothetical protein